MRKITIAARFRPYSHALGMDFLLPNTTLKVRIYPARLEFDDLSHQIPPFFIDLYLKGPVKDFIAQLDLETGILKVSGREENGYFHYSLQANSPHLLLKVHKASNLTSYRSSLDGELRPFLKGEHLLTSLQKKEPSSFSLQERLSLGMHKAQEWESVYSRLDFKEIFPVWHRLCAWLPTTKDQKAVKEGNYQLLEQCFQARNKRQKERILSCFKNFFLSAFEGMLVPCVQDHRYQGILPYSAWIDKHIPPLPLLTEGGKCIRSLFFEEYGQKCEILPCLPAEFHCGRMVGIQTANGSLLDMEWTKGRLRRLRLQSFSFQTVDLKLPKGIRTCRLKVGRKTLPSPFIDKEGHLCFSLENGEAAHLDRFIC